MAILRGATVPDHEKNIDKANWRSMSFNLHNYLTTYRTRSDEISIPCQGAGNLTYAMVRGDNHIQATYCDANNHGGNTYESLFTVPAKNLE